MTRQTVWRRLRLMLQAKRAERDLDDELAFHLEMQARKHRQHGDAAPDAARKARLRFGSRDSVKEACRDVRRPRVLADLAADVRFAWRILARDRWFTAGAVLTLALAMGVANTTFMVTYANLWRDFPFASPNRVAIVRTVDGRGRQAGVSYPDFEDLRRDSRVFEGQAAVFGNATISL